MVDKESVAATLWLFILKTVVLFCMWATLMHRLLVSEMRLNRGRRDEGQDWSGWAALSQGGSWVQNLLVEARFKFWALQKQKTPKGQTQVQRQRHRARRLQLGEMAEAGTSDLACEGWAVLCTAVAFVLFCLLRLELSWETQANFSPFARGEHVPLHCHRVKSWP